MGGEKQKNVWRGREEVAGWGRGRAEPQRRKSPNGREETELREEALEGKVRSSRDKIRSWR